jgi:hypothetical protein
MIATDKTEKTELNLAQIVKLFVQKQMIVLLQTETLVLQS